MESSAQVNTPKDPHRSKSASVVTGDHLSDALPPAVLAMATSHELVYGTPNDNTQRDPLYSQLSAVAAQSTVSNHLHATTPEGISPPPPPPPSQFGHLSNTSARVYQTPPAEQNILVDSQTMNHHQQQQQQHLQPNQGISDTQSRYPSGYSTTAMPMVHYHDPNLPHGSYYAGAPQSGDFTEELAAVDPLPQVDPNAIGTHSSLTDVNSQQQHYGSSYYPSIPSASYYDSSQVVSSYQGSNYQPYYQQQQRPYNHHHHPYQHRGSDRMAMMSLRPWEERTLQQEQAIQLANTLPPLVLDFSQTPFSLPQPEEVVHKQLVGKLPFLPFHPDSPLPPPTVPGSLTGNRVGTTGKISFYTGKPPSNPVKTCDLFVAQLPFDMPLYMLQHLCHLIHLNVVIHHATPHQKRNAHSYDGCAFIKVSQYEAPNFVRTFHKRALFDAHGIWIGRDEQELNQLRNYCTTMQRMKREHRLSLLCRPIPFSAVTAEYAKRAYNFHQT